MAGLARRKAGNSGSDLHQAIDIKRGSDFLRHLKSGSLRARLQDPVAGFTRWRAAETPGELIRQKGGLKGRSLSSGLTGCLSGWLEIGKAINMASCGNGSSQHRTKPTGQSRQDKADSRI